MWPDLALEGGRRVHERRGVAKGELQRAVGRNLKRLRLTMGLSQEAFAESLNYDRTYYAHIERGERNLALQTIEALAAQLNVNPLSLLIDPTPDLPPERPRRGRPRKKP